MPQRHGESRWVGGNDGTVVRAILVDPPTGPPRMLSTSVIASGFPEELNAAALVIGPTGVALNQDGTLYVADTIDNSVNAVPFAAFRADLRRGGDTLSTGGDLNGPLGLVTTPNGNAAGGQRR